MRTFKHLRDDPGNYRVYYTRVESGALYCVQNEGARGKDKFVLNLCSADGEPESAVAMPIEAAPGVAWRLPDSLSRHIIEGEYQVVRP